MSRVRIGIVGAGWWASTTHAPAIAASELADLVAIVDARPDRRVALANRFGVTARFADHRRMLLDCELDAVVVATPHATHAAIATDCLASGVGVLVEKPMTLDPADADRLVDIARRQDVPLVVGMPYPFHRHAAAVRELLGSGAIGDLVCVTGSFHSMVAEFYAGRPQAYRGRRDFHGVEPMASTYSDPASSGGGQGQTQLPHLVGLLLYELGDVAVNRIAARMCLMDPGIDVAVALTAQLGGSAVLALSSSGTATTSASCTGWIRYEGTSGWIHHDALNGRLTAADPALLGGISPPDCETHCEEPYPVHAPVAALIDALHQRRGAGPVRSVPADGALGARTVHFVADCYRTAGVWA